MKTPPRPVPSWDDYYMGLVWFVACRSKDPSTQVGAVIVNADARPLGMGVNGAPSAIPDDAIDWSRPHKYVYIEHAEPNAIKHATRGIGSLVGATLYCTNMPCNDCVRQVVIEKMSRVVYGCQSADMVSAETAATSRMMAAQGGVRLEPFAGNIAWVKDRVRWMEENYPQLFGA